MKLESVRLINCNKINIKQKENSGQNKSVTTSDVINNYGTFHIPFGSTYQNNEFNAKSFLQELSRKNAEIEFIVFKNVDGKFEPNCEILPNSKAINSLKILDSLSLSQKKQFIEEFCSLTGFPNFETVAKNIEYEIINSVNNLTQRENFDTKFIGYDSNCSVGRRLPFPGSDCDCLFIIIAPKEPYNNFDYGKIRLDFKDYINQRILSTPINHLPEILSPNFVEDGLQISQNAFEKCNFSENDLNRFEMLLLDNSKDFVKSADFNIRLSEKIPDTGFYRDLYYKTAMLAEILRDGIICENNFDEELYNKILSSPLYQYSNLMKQKGLKQSLKRKHSERQTLQNNFRSMSIEQQFQIIKDIIYCSFNKIQENNNAKYFTNIGMNNNNEMGNIDKMYDLVLNIPFNSMQ